MNWLARHWWLIFPAWLTAACILGPLIGRWLKRRTRPMPPLQRKVPGLPTDPCSLTDHERVKFWLTTAAYRYVEADDPMEGRTI